MRRGTAARLDDWGGNDFQWRSLCEMQGIEAAPISWGTILTSVETCCRASVSMSAFSTRKGTTARDPRARRQARAVPRLCSRCHLSPSAGFTSVLTLGRRRPNLEVNPSPELLQRPPDQTRRPACKQKSPSSWWRRVVLKKRPNIDNQGLNRGETGSARTASEKASSIVLARRMALQGSSAQEAEIS